MESLNASPLPLLREDIQLLPGPATLNGEPTWAIFDPIRNQYFRISWVAFELLSRWSQGNPSALLAATRDETTCPVGEEDVSALSAFLHQNQLTLLAADRSSVSPTPEMAPLTRLKTLFGQYLFLRIPLVRPDAVFQRLVKSLDPLFSTTLRNLLLCVGLLSLFLISRQWEAFSTTFLYFYTLEGLLVFLLGIVFVKICHELGHALTATRFGCRVASMGVAFLVLFPVLYTDTTDAYRLTSRRKRLYISAAGILTEFYIAIICLFLWTILPDGVFRSVAFVLGTISISLTVLINLNPFLRFDGYYFLADALGIENLQARAFAMGRWQLRELVLGLGRQPPESYSAGMHRFLIVFAWATWTYRLFLMLAIAWFVYSFFFKLLGLILFAGVIYTFLLTPVMKELAQWFRERTAISPARRLALAAIALTGLLLVLIPWRSSIDVQVVAEPVTQALVFPASAAQIVSVQVEQGDQVSAGQVLMTLTSPQLDEDLRQTEISQQVLRYRLQRVAASEEDLQALHVLRQQLLESESKLTALNELKAQLVLRSPIAGTVLELESSLLPGRWINSTLPVAFIADPGEIVLNGYLSETELSRVAPSQPARFVPDQLTAQSFDVTVTSISRANSPVLDQPYQASVFGGAIAVRQDDEGHLVPESAVYRIQLQPTDANSVLLRASRGIAQIEGEPQSILRRAYKVIASAVIRGSAF